MKTYVVWEFVCPRCHTDCFHRTESWDYVCVNGHVTPKVDVFKAMERRAVTRYDSLAEYEVARRADGECTG